MTYEQRVAALMRRTPYNISTVRAALDTLGEQAESILFACAQTGLDPDDIIYLVRNKPNVVVKRRAGMFIILFRILSACIVGAALFVLWELRWPIFEVLFYKLYFYPFFSR